MVQHHISLFYKANPYEIVYGQAPLLHLPYLPQDSQVEVVDRSFVARERMLDRLKENLLVAVNQMKQRADRGRSDWVFNVGDWVFLRLQAYRQLTVERQRSAKLLPWYFGPYEVLEQVGEMCIFVFRC